MQINIPNIFCAPQFPSKKVNADSADTIPIKYL